MAGERIVVTGGAGYYGSWVIRMLLDAGYKVHVIDNLMYGPMSIMELFINRNFSFTRGDILDTELLARELDGADAVIHLAALVGYPLCKKEPERAKAVNVQGTKNVIAAMDPATKLVYASTGSNYGEVEGICTEETPLNPLSLYGETKTEAEYLCMARGNVVSYRFATAFGLSPRLRLDLMINDFTWQALVQRYLVVYEKHFRRTFIHVYDMARTVMFTLENWDRMVDNVYNVGHDSMNYTKEDIVRVLQSKLDFMVHFAEVGSDLDKRDYEVSYDKIGQLGFETSIDIRHGMDELIHGLSLVEFRRPYSNV
ncbi:MAG: NAD-dependent epimerase/dehydratase family protein [Alphaproteobacteria bacterium]|nr:NAD-dependent epimerase/dehydratase family protein [Alphaproteobacteria bacterium]